MDSAIAAECAERQQEELDGLRAIYLPEELSVEAFDVQFGVRYSIAAGWQLRIRLPALYPVSERLSFSLERNANAVTSSSNSSNDDAALALALALAAAPPAPALEDAACTIILETLEAVSAEEVGCEHLMLAIQTAVAVAERLKEEEHLAQQARAAVEEGAAAPTTTAVAGEEAAAAAAPAAAVAVTQAHPPELVQVCLFIDHMNDHLTYMKKVRRWTKELGLTGVALYRMRAKHINAVSGGGKVVPKGRAEDIYVLLEGEASEIKDFLTRLRTFKMTSQDRREKKSKVLWDNKSSSLGGGGGGGGGGEGEGGKGGEGAGGGSGEDGRANLQQLHLIRAFQDTAASKRPLLDANSKNITNPVNRMLTSNKFFKGRFFFNNGGCQSKECVLINFPKAGRGSVRLQVKAWHGDAREISSGANGASHPDTKAQFLSYIGWIFGVSGIDPSKIGTWPQDMEGTGGCDFCRTKVGTFQSDVYLCINPFHYVKPPKHSAMKIRLAQEMKTCLKDRPVLPGETPAGAHAGADQSAASKSRCYCLKCRKL